MSLRTKIPIKITRNEVLTLFEMREICPRDAIILVLFTGVTS